MKFKNEKNEAIMVERRKENNQSDWYTVLPGETKYIPVTREVAERFGLVEAIEPMEADIAETTVETKKISDHMGKRTRRKIELESLKMAELRKIGKSLDCHDTKKSELISEILSAEGY